MNKRSISALLCILIALSVAIVIAQGTAPNSKAESMLLEQLGNRQIQIRSDALRLRGVSCGTYRLVGDSACRWQPYIYVDHFSSDSSPESKIFTGWSPDTVKERTTHGC
jgi:hypothetical protein